MEQVSDLPNVRFYTANEDIQAGGLVTMGIDGIVRAVKNGYRTPSDRHQRTLGEGYAHDGHGINPCKGVNPRRQYNENDTSCTSDGWGWRPAKPTVSERSAL